MGPWDYLHCPPGTAHITIGAGDGPCAILMVGTRAPDATTRYIADPVAHGTAPRSRSRPTRHARPTGTPAAQAGPVALAARVRRVGRLSRGDTPALHGPRPPRLHRLLAQGLRGQPHGPRVDGRLQPAALDLPGRARGAVHRRARPALTRGPGVQQVVAQRAQHLDVAPGEPLEQHQPVQRIVGGPPFLQRAQRFADTILALDERGDDRRAAPRPSGARDGCAGRRAGRWESPAPREPAAPGSRACGACRSDRAAAASRASASPCPTRRRARSSRAALRASRSA